MTHDLTPLRRRLWPTRRSFDHHQGELERRIDDLASTVQSLTGEVRRLAEEMSQLAADQQRLIWWEAEVRTRARRTQALVARTYERLENWPELLATARAQPEYELAYTEPDPLVSIPIPTYHSPDTLCDRALASVLAQSHSNWEAIVVGDHCTDDTEVRVRALRDPRISFHNLAARENDPDDPWERWAVRGSAPRATGISLSRGRWIAPLSHDDAWDPDHLQTLLETARSSRAEVVYSRMRCVSPEEPDSVLRVLGGFPPRHAQFSWQAAIAHGGLDFLRFDRNCALASEPNDWNLARRAWEAGVRFHHLERETMTLFVHDRLGPIQSELAAMGLPPSATAQ